MNNLTLRNVLILIGVVIAVLVVLGILSTILTQIVPIGIALLVGFIVGRLSTNAGMMQRITGRGRESADGEAAETAAKPARRQRPARKEAAAEAAPEAEPDAESQAEAIKARLADVEAEQPTPEATDFEIKTEDEVLAEASRLEDEIKKRAAEYDPSAALEERRRRLLGDRADE